MKKKKYLMNCFRFVMDAFEEHTSEYEFKHIFAKEGKLDFIFDYFHFRKALKKGRFDEYEVIHINNWVNFLNIPDKNKRKNQIWISESHGFHIGLNNEKAMEDSVGIRKIIGYILSFFLARKIRKKLNEFDIVYAAIPNVIADLKKVDPKAEWLPNPIDVDLFSRTKEISLEGDPSIFYPTRMHKMKTPEVGFKIFRKIKEKYPCAKLHMIKYPERMSQYDSYKYLLDEFKNDIIWHGFMQRNKLPEFYSSVDLVLGSFGKGLLSLMEMEAMACETTVVTHDDFEIVKIKLKDLPDFALKLMDNADFRKKYTKKCTDYVRKIHNPKNVLKIHIANINKALSKKKIK